MAKEGKTGSLGMFAFIAIVLNVIAWILTGIFTWLNITITIGGHSLTNLMTAISSLLLVFVVLIVAWDFAKRQSKGWRIFYWIVAILSLLSIFFGVGINFVK